MARSKPVGARKESSEARPQARGVAQVEAGLPPCLAHFVPRVRDRERPGLAWRPQVRDSYADLSCDLTCDLMSADRTIPAVDHEVFPNPPLKAMLGQLRFPTVLRIADLGSLGPFQEAIRAEFPTYREEQQVSLLVGPQGPQAPQTQRAHRFVTEDRAWNILLTPDAVTLEADVAAGYTSYDAFVCRFRLVWETLLASFSPSQIERQGLRYVDHIEGDHTASEWAAFINPELLGSLVERFGDTISQSASEVRVTRGDGVLVFKHGMLPIGPSNTRGYLLDFDYFIEEPQDDTSLEAVMDRFDGYHQMLYSMFRWCVTDAALEGFRAA
jgi:uncharacterized protein (TIGR04255 family)